MFCKCKFYKNNLIEYQPFLFLISEVITQEKLVLFLYKGILTVSKDPEVRDFFSHKHLNTESQHLELIEKVLEKNTLVNLLFFGSLPVFLTGLIPALLGKNLFTLQFIMSKVLWKSTTVNR